MFKSARIKLTLWYLAIIMMVSLSFSAFIYRSISLEFERRLNTIEARLQLGRFGFQPPPGQVELFIQDLEDAKERVLLILTYTNMTILVFSAVAGYVLAGKTLHPIELAMEGQKRFVADASHELKTPLTSIKSEIEVALRDKNLKLKDAKEMLKSNLEEVDKIKDFSDYLLTLSRLESGASLSMEEVDLKEAALQAIRRNSKLAKEKNIKVNADLAEVVVKGNPQSLVELISILLNNAIKYSGKEKEIMLSLRKKRSNAIFEVKDEGIGISDADLPYIFDRFYRADSSRNKNEVDGYGLGLSIAKSIIDAHKGEIKVKSERGKGSAFSVYLPAL